MSNRRLLLLTALIVLPLAAAQAQPAVPAVPPARTPARAAAPAPRPTAPAVTAPTPTAVAPASADDPPTSVSAAPAPAPVASATQAPAAAPAPNSAAPAADAPVADAPPTAAPEPVIPTEASLQTVPRNFALTPEGNARFLVDYAARPDVKTLTGGLMYRALVTGSGKVTPVSRFDTVTVSYRGWLVDGTSFDSSPPGVPRTFQLSALIPGWRDALMKMKQGDLWEVVIPADLAYGAEGRPGRIPPNQTLIFVISVAKIEYAG